LLKSLTIQKKAIGGRWGIPRRRDNVRLCSRKIPAVKRYNQIFREQQLRALQSKTYFGSLAGGGYPIGVPSYFSSFTASQQFIAAFTQSFLPQQELKPRFLVTIATERYGVLALETSFIEKRDRGPPKIEAYAC